MSVVAANAVHQPTARTVQPATLPDVDTPRHGRVALTFFFNLMNLWDVPAEDQMVLLGSVSKTTFYKYRKTPEVRLPRDTMERISYLMGIHKSLRIMFGDKPSTYDWVKRPNTDAPFNGQTALNRMLAGSIVDLADVRRYLDAARG